LLGVFGLLAAIAGGVVCWRYEKTILRLLHRGPVQPPRAMPVAGFSAFKKLSDFTGVECYYTSKFAEPLTVVDEPSPISLMPMSKVVVQKVDRENAEYDHPASSGFKVFATTKGALAAPNPDNPGGPVVHLLDVNVVLYPIIGDHDEVIELRLCPISACKKAQELWLDKTFKYSGSQIGDSQIDPGTLVTVTDVQPAYFGTSGVTFDLALKLPTGETVRQSINPDNMGLLQPAGQ